jgi:hypothetical protein
VTEELVFRMNASLPGVVIVTLDCCHLSENVHDHSSALQLCGERESSHFFELARVLWVGILCGNHHSSV